jgi:hypothetical protein
VDHVGIDRCIVGGGNDFTPMQGKGRTIKMRTPIAPAMPNNPQSIHPGK